MLKLEDRNLVKAVFHMFKMLSQGKKDILSRINSRLDGKEEKICEYKGIVMESQNETEKRIFLKK